MSANEMIMGLLGQKLRMTQIFQEDGKLIPVTALQVGPCHVLNIRTLEKEGYRALQMGFGLRKKKNLKKPQLKYYEKINVPPVAFVREIPFGTNDLLSQVKVGDELGLDVFEGVDKVDITAYSKGRGFAGCIKRHNFHRGPVTHGCKNIREPGSTGSSATPGRTVKGKKMPGQHGSAQVTTKNLKIVQFFKEENIIFVKGAVPGPSGGYLLIRKSVVERNKWGLPATKSALAR